MKGKMLAPENAALGRESSMRLFMLSLMIVYAGFGLAFLLVPARLSATQAGAWFTSRGPASQVWGVLFLGAAALVNAGLVWPARLRLRALAFLVALFVGGAWATAGLLITVFYGVDPTRPLFWLWVVFVLLFVEVHLAPYAQPMRVALAAMPRALTDPLRTVLGGHAARDARDANLRHTSRAATISPPATPTTPTPPSAATVRPTHPPAPIPALNGHRPHA